MKGWQEEDHLESVVHERLWILFLMSREFIAEFGYGNDMIWSILKKITLVSGWRRRTGGKSESRKIREEDHTSSGRPGVQLEDIVERGPLAEG